MRTDECQGKILRRIVLVVGEVNHVHGRSVAPSTNSTLEVHHETGGAMSIQRNAL